MNHRKKIVYGAIVVMCMLIAWFTWLVLFQIPKSRIEYQKYEDNLNAVSQDVIEILQQDPEIYGISKESLIDEQDHRCGLEGGDGSCIQKFKLIQRVVSKIPSKIWFYRCHFSKGDVFIRQRRHYFGLGAHKYEFFVPVMRENSMRLRWVEYNQNRDSGYEIECYPWEDE